MKLNGKEIIAYSIEAFTKAKALDAFVVVVDEKSYKNGSVAEKYGVDCILGGNSRNASVRNALDYIKVKYPDCKNVMIHEAVGVVVQDKSGTLARGTRVAMVTNISPAEHTIVKDNYSRDSKFCSSSADGFMQDLVAVPGDRLIPLPEGMDEKAFVFTEPLSVAFNAVKAFQRVAVTPKTALGLWGDGSIGFLLALVLRHVYPDSKIYVFGHNRKKLQRFSFAEEIYFSDMPPEDFKLDHCFECVGGSKAEDAINQMIDMINPQGVISLLGVSEELVGLNTRMILEKGLQLIGNSRSVARDMQAAVDLIGGDEAVGQYLQTIISNECDVRSVDDIYNAFELDKLGDFKTVIHWNV